MALNKATGIFNALFGLPRRKARGVYLALFAAFILPTLLLGFFSFLSLYDNDTKSALAENKNEVFLIANIIKERLDMLVELGESIAKRPSLAVYLRSGQWEEAVKSIAHIPGDFEYVDRVFLVDVQGIIKAQTPDTPSYLGFNRSQTDWYKGTSFKWRSYLSEVYPDPILPNRNIIAVAIPVKEEQNIEEKPGESVSHGVLGILMFHAPVRIFADLVQNETVVSAGEFIYIVDNKGHIVFHPKIGTERGGLDFSSAPAVQKLLHGQRGSGVNYNPIEKETRLVTYDIVPRYNWGVVIAKPHAIAFVQRHKNSQIFALVFSVVLALVTSLASLIIIILKERARIDKLKDEFISTVSHEIRNPLFGIRESIAQISEGILGATTKEQNEFLSIALSSIDRISRIINDLLDISRIESGKFRLQLKWCDLADIAQRTIASLLFQAKSKGVEVKGSFPECKASALVDEDRIEQVFFNLITNAIKFTPQGSVEVRVGEKKDCFECSVSDSGTGIVEKQLKHIFSEEAKFVSVTQERGKGTGLGLVITKKIIDLHSGKIWIQSEVGKGTTVTFILPKYAQEEAARRFLDSVRSSVGGKQPLVMLFCSVEDADSIKKKISSDQFKAIMKKLERCLYGNMQRIAGDIIIKDGSSFLMLFPRLSPEQGAVAREKIEAAFHSCLENEGVRREIGFVVIDTIFPKPAVENKELFLKIVNIISAGNKLR